jgi:CubicO group peptidase (beta-lactamase class C family)
MRQVTAGTLALDDRVSKHLPEFEGPGKEVVTVRQLLAHTSGLPPHRPFYQQVGEAPSARLAIALAAAREPLEYAPGSRSRYSDLGFIVLGWLLERLTGVRLDEQAGASTLLASGDGAATFVNLADSEARARLLATRSVAATERCPVRGRVVLGEVHDLNAYAMGGIAGHAGLFGTAADLDRIARALVGAWHGEGAWTGAAGADLGLSREVLREFWRPAGVPDSTWRLGWDGPAAEGSQAGTRLSRAAVGHLGYTGCSLWIDPERARWIILLTNRVHPTVRDDPGFKSFRPALHDAAVDTLDAIEGGVVSG